MTSAQIWIAVLRPYRSLAVLVLSLAACGAPDRSKQERPADKPFVPPTRAATTSGFEHPVAARYDSAADVFFVVNRGADSAGSSHAFISRVRPDGGIDSLHFILDGRGGAHLDAPGALTLEDDTLWVVDRQRVRAFDARTGAPGPVIDLSAEHAVDLAGIARGPDGALYVTDRGAPPQVPQGRGATIRPDRIFRIAPDHAVSTALVSDSLERPSGITWDAHDRRFIVVSFGGASIFSWHPGDAQPRRIGHNSAQMEGVAMLPDGRMLVTSQRDSSLTIRSADKLTVIGGFPMPSFVGVDTRRNHVAVPLRDRDRVDIWAIPPLAP